MLVVVGYFLYLVLGICDCLLFGGCFSIVCWFYVLWLFNSVVVIYYVWIVWLWFC